jgi:hypothetical protein
MMDALFGMWCLTSLSAIFQLYRDGVLLVEETGENDLLQVTDKHYYIMLHNVVSSTPRHERGSNSQLWW